MEGTVVLITGAKGGLGTYVTQAFLDAGASVAGVSRSIQNSDFDHPRFVAVSAALSTSEAARQASNVVSERLGRIDVLVHLVGGFAGGAALDETSGAVFDQMFDLNVRSAFHMIAAVLPQMKKQRSGHVIAIGSRAAAEPTAGAAIYSASKAALVAMVAALAKENADWSFSANTILPGTMDTQQNRASSPEADFSRWVQPAQVAQLAVSLAGSLTQVNGAAIPIYGSGL